MRKLITAALIATSVTVLAQSAAPARGSKLTPVNPFPGYRGKRGHYAGDIDLGFKTERTSPRAINGDGAVSGWFIDTNGLQHGFLRLSDGSVQVIDLDDSGTTVLEGLNNHQCIVGQT